MQTQNDKSGPWWRAQFGGPVTVSKVQILNRGDSGGKRLNGAKIFIGDTLCGKVQNAKAGEWITLNCKASGQMITVQGKAGQYLHFCGIKVWAISNLETLIKACEKNECLGKSGNQPYD